jgi:creatinine amidohydrolase
MTDMRAQTRLAEMSAADFARLSAARPVVLLPLGSHEDHGPSLPMGDYVTAEILAGRIAAAAAALGVPAVVAPCLPFGVADYFGSSPGGMALGAATFRAVLEDMLAGLLRHGLDKILILNAHGGNVPVIHEVTLALRRARGVVVPSFYLWKVAREIMARLAPNAVFGHGAEPLASLTAALRPDAMVDGAAPHDGGGTLLGLKVNGFGTLAFEGVSVEAPAEFADVPKVSTAPDAALGAKVADELVATAARLVARLAK